MWLGFSCVKINRKAKRAVSLPATFLIPFTAHFYCLKPPALIVMCTMDANQNRQRKFEPKFTSISPCEPPISNVLHRVFLLLPMMESVWGCGSSRKLFDDYHLKRADSQIEAKCRQNGAFRTTYTRFPYNRFPFLSRRWCCVGCGFRSRCKFYVIND